MFHITTYDIIQCRKCDFRNVLNNKVIAAIENFLQEINRLRNVQVDNQLFSGANSAQNQANFENKFNSQNTHQQVRYRQYQPSHIAKMTPISKTKTYNLPSSDN